VSLHQSTFGNQNQFYHNIIHNIADVRTKKSGIQALVVLTRNTVVTIKHVSHQFLPSASLFYFILFCLLRTSAGVVVFSVAPVCVSVCLSVAVCSALTYERFELESSFWYAVHLQKIQVKFVDQGHRVKVKVTGAKACQCFPQGQHCSKIMRPPQSLPLQMVERLLELS